MTTKITDYGGVTVLNVSEDLSGDAVEVFGQQAAECLREHKHNIVIDCSAVGAMDSAALESLLDLQDKCEEELGSVKLCGLSATCGKVLEITRLARRFEAFEDLDSAVRSFG
jgi:anti-anti-sigma factor